MKPEIRLYTGKGLISRQTIVYNGETKEISPYLPDEDLVKAVQLAQILGRPLLLKGEPGCGKSRLAEAVAFELFGNDFPAYYFEWHIKSTSKAQDGLYTIDHLKRMRDASLRTEQGKDITIRLYKDEYGNYLPSGEYVQLGELGKAFQMSSQAKRQGGSAPPVVLIDEVDKADIDFPNDLLLELDRMEFTIPDALDKDGSPVSIKASPDFRPLLIITSNDEKPLPPAFLRRCLFHYIGFEKIKLTEIVKSNFDLPESLVHDAVNQFKEWRKKIEEKQVSSKNISTSELLDWVRLISHYYQLDGGTPQFETDALPSYYQALLKDAESIKLFAKKEPLMATLQ